MASLRRRPAPPGAVEPVWLRQARHRVLDHAHGTVLDLGAGGGTDPRCYRGVTEVVACATDPGARRRLRAMAGAAAVPVRVAAADPAGLPFATAAFDTVVTTLAFCAVPDPARAAAELLRVLRPGGTLLLVEHAAPAAPVRRVAGRLLGGCRTGPRTLEVLRLTGFDVRELDRLHPGRDDVVLARAGAPDARVSPGLAA